MPDGHVIAISSAKVHEVRAEREQYENTMSYYKISLIDMNRFLDPIIVKGFNVENYVGFYFNKQLIVGGKITHFLENDVYLNSLNLLIIDKLELRENIISNFRMVGFFLPPQQNSDIESKNSLSSDKQDSSTDSAENFNNINSDFSQKRKRDSNENSGSYISSSSLVEEKSLPIVKKQKTTHTQFFAAKTDSNNESKDIGSLKSNVSNLNKFQPTP